MTDYETDTDGRYWITAEGERIQVPFDKILQRTDNPTGRAVACLRHYHGHPVVRCFIGPPKAKGGLHPKTGDPTPVLPGGANPRRGLGAAVNKPRRGR